jgi:hypothetical protein
LPRIIYFTNIGDDDDEETPYSVKLSSDEWAFVFGEPLSEDEIRSLRDEFSKGTFK